MRRLVLAALVALGGSPAFAFDPCDDLWFSRNQVFDMAGYCFSSALGKAVFDNSDCISSKVTPDVRGMALVNFAKELEADLNCKVDTSRRWLDVDNLAMRRALEVPVVLEDSASGCLGWTGDPIPLFAGPRPGAQRLATVKPGDDIVWEYTWIGEYPGWSFVTIHRNTQQIGLGWMWGNLNEGLCTGLAG